MKNAPVFLETINLTKRFGETTAVDKVSLKINKGEIRGLIGENGSGKSTISSMISAIHTVTAGDMLVEGKPYRPKSPTDARHHGISMIVQESGTIETLSVAENIFLGDEQRFSRKRMIDRTAMNKEAAAALAAIGVTEVDVTRPIGIYNFEMRKLIEVARAYYYDPVLFIVDETTTALSHSGREKIYELMAALKEHGKAVLFISHDIPELMETCDVLTILRDGKLVESIGKADFSENKIKQSMVGREIKGDYYRSDYDSAHGDKVMLAAKTVSAEDVRAVDLILHEGEILGLGGLSGCGMHQLGRMLFGLEKPQEGQIRAFDSHTGQLTELTGVRRALECDIGYISKDRDSEALILPASIKDNLTISALRKLGKFILPQAEKNFAAKQVTDLSVRCASINQPVRELSGGNKQKISFGKWIGNGSRILIMDCPTRGVDVGVKTTMYQLIYRLKKEGYAILIISEELPELIGMCDAVIIMKDGRTAARFERSPQLRDTQLIEYMI